MENTIYVISHPSITSHPNKTLKWKIEHQTNVIYVPLKDKHISRIFTCRPLHTEHESIQIASNLCTLFNVGLELYDQIDHLPPPYVGNVIVMCNPWQMNEVLNQYGFIGQVRWDDSNDEGCIRMNSHGWEYDRNFFDTRSAWWCF